MGGQHSQKFSFLGFGPDIGFEYQDMVQIGCHKQKNK